MFKIKLLIICILSANLFAYNIDSEKWDKLSRCRFIHPQTKVEKYLAPDSMNIAGTINNGIAELTFTQYFDNPTDTILSLEYNFPMPQNASVHHFQYKSDDKIFNSEILKTETAQALYDSLNNAGQQAALLSQIRPNIFAQSIANIPGLAKIEVQIKLSYPLDFLDDQYQFTFPTMIGERYQSTNDEIPSSNLGYNPPDSLVYGQVKINLILSGETDYTTITHPLVDSILIANNSKQIQFKSQSAIPNKDIQFKIKTLNNKLGMNLSTYKNASDSLGFLNFSFTPPDSLFKGTENKEVLFLIDRSGSQGGWPLEYQKRIANTLIDNLFTDSYFQVMAFDDFTQTIFSKPQLANPTNKAIAKTFINNISTGGGTQLLNALNAYLKTPNTAGLPRVLVLLTDGFITNETEVFSSIKEQKDIPSLITYGLGNGVNHYFLEEAALIGNGFSLTVTEDQNPESVAEQTFDKINSILVKLTSITWENAMVSNLVGTDPSQFFPGMRYSVFGNYKNSGQNLICVNIENKTIKNSFCEPFNFNSQDTLFASIPKNWAKQKIKDLEILAYNDTVLQNKIINLSTQYSVLSNYTSFIAYDQTPKNVEEDDNYILGGAPMYSPIIGLTPIIQKDKIEFKANFSFHISIKENLLSLTLDHSIDQVLIYDMQGKLIFEKEINSSKEFEWFGLDTKGVQAPKGQYIIKFKVNNQWISKSFIWNN